MTQQGVHGRARKTYGSYYPIRNIYNRDMCSCSEFLVVKRIKKTCLISDQVVTDEAVLG